MNKFKVGDIVVVGFSQPWGVNPVIHASDKITKVGGHGARGTILNIGKKWAYIESSRASILKVDVTKNDSSDSHEWKMFTIEDARKGNRKHHEYFGHKTKEEIEISVSRI